MYPSLSGGTVLRCKDFVPGPFLGHSGPQNLGGGGMMEGVVGERWKAPLYINIGCRLGDFSKPENSTYKVLTTQTPEEKLTCD